MSTPAISYRPDIISAFKGCLVAHAAAVHVLAKHDPKLALLEHWEWAPELYYTHFLVSGYIKTKGRLDLPEMKKKLQLGLELEKGARLSAAHFGDEELEFREMADLHRTISIKKLRRHNRDEDWIGGPGVAAHISAVGLVNRSDLGRIVEDSHKIGWITHPHEIAISAGMVTALAIALAVTEGNQPEAIIARLMSTLRTLKPPYQVPVKLMRKLTRVEGLLKREIDTTQGIGELRSKPRRTAIDVVPGAIYAALNGARSLGGLLGPLKIFGNYKSGAIASSIWGAMHGVEAVSNYYLHDLEDSKNIEDNAQALYEATLAAA